MLSTDERREEIKLYLGEEEVEDGEDIEVESK